MATVCPYSRSFSTETTHQNVSVETAYISSFFGKCALIYIHTQYLFQQFIFKINMTHSTFWHMKIHKIE